ncbi:enoyl-CoA hydratase/isomerase family protein (plasmid) [Nocardioides sp. R1-1]|uniref:enoyl-CoA hydratase/isomerase family protein n=1 Tax=Nocardioides sp. R1-1 TaxID=3383502 RepID=UPI0038D1E4B8
MSGQVVGTLEEEVLVLRLDDEATLNALSAAMLADLALGIRSASDDGAVRGVVVTGTGRAFSSGENLRETSSLVGAEGIGELSRLFNDITEAVLASRVPCVAAVNGVAVGGAAELTLCFDRRIGTTSSMYLFPESAMGFTISNAASILLPALIGRSAALDVVLSGRRLDASESHRLGLLDEVVDDPAVLLDRCRAYIASLTPQGNTAHLHLGLLRPDIDTVRQAFSLEAEAARTAWESGAMDAQIARYDGS